jgi:hypothetical protein
LERSLLMPEEVVLAPRCFMAAAIIWASKAGRGCYWLSMILFPKAPAPPLDFLSLLVPPAVPAEVDPGIINCWDCRLDWLVTEGIFIKAWCLPPPSCSNSCFKFIGCVLLLLLLDAAGCFMKGLMSCCCCWIYPIIFVIFLII